MSAIETGLVSRLTGYASVSALVGTRVVPARHVSMDIARPYITYQVIGSNEDVGHQGSNGFSRTDFVLELWAASYLDAKALADVVRDCLEGFRGTFGTITVGAVFFDEVADVIDPQQTGQETAFCGIRNVLHCNWTRVLPVL